MRPDRRPVHRLPVLRQEVNFPHPAPRQPPRRGDLCSVIRCLRSRDCVPLFPYRKFRADCSKTGDEVCKKWRAKKFAGALKFFCPPFIMKLQSKIGSCKEVFRTRAATITRLARQSVSDEDLKHFLLYPAGDQRKGGFIHVLTHKRTRHHPRRGRQGLLRKGRRRL